MKKLTEDELKSVERYGKAFLPADKLSVVMDIPLDEIKAELSDSNSALYRAYYRGFYLSELEVRESVISLAKGGSGPAQMQAVKFWEDAKLELLS